MVQTMSKIFVLILSSGNAAMLARTLQSIDGCEPSSGQTGVIVIENGQACVCEAVCGRPTKNLDVCHRFLPGLDQGHALNIAIEALPDDALLVFSDDDIRYGSQTLVAYDRAASKTAAPSFFGGPFGCDYEQDPLPWIVPYLPVSAIGWSPHLEKLNPTGDRFQPFNWAAFAKDIKRCGGFASRPLSPSVFRSGGPTRDIEHRQVGHRQIGHHRAMQGRMQAAGMLGAFVPGAFVYRFVPENRCSVDWAIRRAYRIGVSRGVARREQTVPTIALHHWSNGIGLLASTGLKWLSSLLPSSKLHFHAQHRQQRTLGYFRGFREDTGEQERRAA
jgi:hypothetical protein